MGEVSGYLESKEFDSANVLLRTDDSGRTERACTDIFRSAGATRGVVVAVEWSVEDWLAALQDRDGLPDELVVVSVGEGARTTATAQPGSPIRPAPDRPAGEPVVDFVPAGDLATLGQTINRHLTAASDPAMGEPPRTVLCLDSIAALVEASDVRTVFRFLHILTSLVSTQGATAHYHLDPGQLDSETVATLSVLFDSTLER